MLDLDNTLWGGIVGDDGVDGIAIGPEVPEGQVYAEFQSYCKALQTIGVVLAVMNARSVMRMWRSFLSLFLMTSAIILLLVFIVTSLTSMRQIQPIREMVQATRAYAAGNFDVRMQDADRGDEIGELAAGFNNMADSLAETERQRRDFIANISHD